MTIYITVVIFTMVILAGCFEIYRGIAERSHLLFIRYRRRNVDIAGSYSKCFQRRVGRSSTKSVVEIRRRNEGQTEKRDDGKLVAPARCTE